MVIPTPIKKAKVKDLKKQTGTVRMIMKDSVMEKVKVIVTGYAMVITMRMD